MYRETQATVSFSICFKVRNEWKVWPHGLKFENNDKYFNAVANRWKLKRLYEVYKSLPVLAA